MAVQWSEVQVCGQCGTGTFTRTPGGMVLCGDCGHEHTLDRWNLEDCESFTWTSDGRLSVTCQD